MTLEAIEIKAFVLRRAPVGAPEGARVAQSRLRILEMTRSTAIRRAPCQPIRGPQG